MTQRPKLLFVSPRFLFPVDSGGKIRTTQILRGMHGGGFEITLLSPAKPEQVQNYAEDLRGIADATEFWPSPARGRAHSVLRMRHLLSDLPIPVATDFSRLGANVIDHHLRKDYDAVVFDFTHSAVLAPRIVNIPAILFTHNVEAEIFGRHARVARDPVRKWIWSNQHRKMQKFEAASLKKFPTIVAVSQRDLEEFQTAYDVDDGHVIGTGVDLDYFHYQSPAENERIVFTGSMDWLANINGIEFMMEEVWPSILGEYPNAHFDIVGRDPPLALRRRAEARKFNWHFTGFVDDVRDYVSEAAVYVIPLLVGGGTRLKVYEAMAMGAPVVSTDIGVEGLPVKAGEHYLAANSGKEFANAIIKLLGDAKLRRRFSQQARHFVEQNCSYRSVANEFEEICRAAISAQTPRSSRISA